MTNEKNIKYKKAYTELNEIFKILEKEQRDKIPESFVNNILNNMDKNYNFKYDNSKGIFEQNLMVETESLLVEIYERYLAPNEEKEIWQKYDRFCLNKIEEDKKAKYSNNVFENNETFSKDEVVKENIDQTNLPIEIKKQNILKRILDYILKKLDKFKQ